MADCGCSTKNFTPAENKEASPFKDRILFQLCAKSKEAREAWYREGIPSIGPLYDAKCNMQKEVQQRTKLCATMEERSCVYSDVRTSLKHQRASLFSHSSKAWEISVCATTCGRCHCLKSTGPFGSVDSSLLLTCYINHKLKQTLLRRDWWNSWQLCCQNPSRKKRSSLMFPLLQKRSTMLLYIVCICHVQFGMKQWNLRANDALNCWWVRCARAYPFAFFTFFNYERTQLFRGKLVWGRQPTGHMHNLTWPSIVVLTFFSANFPWKEYPLVFLLDKFVPKHLFVIFDQK